jgi:hypothetical protein
MNAQPYETELIPRHSLENLCAAFKAAAATARENATRNKAAAAHLAAIWGEAPENRHRSINIELQTPEEVEAAIVKAKRYAWSAIVDRTGLRHLMSVKQQEELERQLWDEGSKWKPGQADNLPALTPETVYGWLAQLSQSLPSMLDAAIDEIFDMLTPQRRKRGDTYKTNDAHCRELVGRKVILTWYLESYWHGLRHDRQKYLTALGNVFRMLEGKGPEQYPNDLPTRLTGWWKEHPSDPFQDDYFTIKAYWHTRTLHIAMKRIDLVQELNVRAGRRALATPAV